MALRDGQRETVTAAYLDKHNAEEDARSHVEGQYTHWMVDSIDIKDARKVLNKRKSTSTTPHRRVKLSQRRH